MQNPFIKTVEQITREKGTQVFTKGQLFPLIFASIGVTLGLVIATRFVDISITPKQRFISSTRTQSTKPETKQVDTSKLQEQVFPSSGVILPIQWKTFGKQMISDGVIDETKFRAIFQTGLTQEEESLLTGSPNKPIVLNASNSRFLLDILWAFGLANKNEILEKGEMADKQYGGAGNFASTGGWTLSVGKPMDHYSKHAYATLTKTQQDIVDRVSRNIYRPCCGNSTHFPDCNHGMAMLGLLELMAAQNAPETQMYQVALSVNSYWFPQTYLDLATYFQEQGIAWKNVDPRTVLSSEYSSSQGYQATRQKIQSLPKPASGGGGCGA